MIDDTARRRFRQTVWSYYRLHGRHDLPWRQLDTAGALNPYHILVSEIMLQQTQVGRVIPKYQQFLAQFPTVQALAAAPIGEVLRAWSGLGYNRRAKFLQQAASAIVERHNGRLPDQVAELIKLPGVGRNTAGAVLAYAFNQPAVFVETNLRTVLIHHFFADDGSAIRESAILELVGDTLETARPRDWYWALMDYGSHLKQTVGNLNVRSQGFTRQSRFQGSRRQLRGQILRLLGERPHSLVALQQATADERLESVLAELLAEQLIRRHRKRYLL